MLGDLKGWLWARHTGQNGGGCTVGHSALEKVCVSEVARFPKAVGLRAHR